MNKIKSIVAGVVILILFAAITVLSVIDFPTDYKTKETPLIHLYGERHGSSDFYEAELAAWSAYYQNGHRYLFVELPYYTAEFLNVWMQEEGDEVLDRIYEDIEGTLSHTSEFLKFYHQFKEKYPETVFVGTDVGHQFYSTGARYLSYLEGKGLQGSEQYVLAQICISQGEEYRGQSATSAYREQKMMENFIAAYDRIGVKEIMGIYGSYHTDATYADRMAGMLKAHYGDIVEGNYVINIIANRQHPFTWGISYVGIIFLLMLFIPNIIWTRFQPKGYAEYAKRENKILGVIEKIGEVSVVCILVCFSDFNLHITRSSSGVIIPARTWYLALALALMILYEIYWIRYFRSKREMTDFYRDILGIPLAGATLPVAASLIIGIYGCNPALILAAIVLGIGHIGIHWQHYKNVKQNKTIQGEEAI